MMKTIIRTIQQKGIIESCHEAVKLVILIVISKLRIYWLSVRGYSISHQAEVSLTSDLFQSTKGAISIGSRSSIRRNTRISAGFDGKIRIGANVLIDEGTKIMAQKFITIGDDTLISADCFIVDFNHRTQYQAKIGNQGYTTDPVRIGKDVWIGTHTVILPGVTIGNGAVIGAGSIVTHDIPPNTVAAGNPARILRKRTTSV